MNFIDSHCHLPGLNKKTELEQILAGAVESGVGTFINIGTSLKENTEAIRVAETYDRVYATTAIYPHEHRGDKIDDLIERLEEQARSSKRVVAIGECGIDISAWKNQRPVDEQIRLFEAQAGLAKKLNLPLVVHNRKSDEIVLETLRKVGGLRGVIHCYDSDWPSARKFLDLGFMISFSGLITYPAKNYLLETVRNVPSDSYLIETDSPYLLPEPVRSAQKPGKDRQRNEPKYVRIVGQKAAEVRQISTDQAAKETRANTRRLFGLI